MCDYTDRTVRDEAADTWYQECFEFEDYTYDFAQWFEDQKKQLADSYLQFVADQEAIDDENYQAGLEYAMSARADHFTE